MNFYAIMGLETGGFMKKNIKALKFEKIKEIIHPNLIKMMKQKTTGELVVDGTFPVDGNYLIVANHACIEDIPTLGQAVDKHFYLLVSDEDKYTIDGLGLELNGVQWVKRTDKISRERAYSNIIEILKRGKNFAVYPEATWNLSPNQLMMPMNYGCIRMSLESGKSIVPVVTYFTKDKRYTKIGDPFKPTNDLVKSIDELRSIMASMMYELMEKFYEEEYKKGKNVCYTMIDNVPYYYEKRALLQEGAWDNDIKNRYSVYKRARDDMKNVRTFESQFIFTPKEDKYQFFQEFNCKMYKDVNSNTVVERITAEHDGYQGITFGEEELKDSFGFGYNERVLKK